VVKKIVYVINSIPLAGKLTIHPFAYSYWTATTKRGKLLAFIGLFLVLGLFIPAHGGLALLGFGAISLSKPIFLNIIFISYGLVNTAVVVAQCHLLFRATKHLPQSLPKISKKYVGMGSSSIIVHIIFTTLGQLTFLVACRISQGQ
jgi:hypothetical protein